MKLKNLYTILLCGLLFSGCSKDEEPQDPPTPTPGKIEMNFTFEVEPLKPNTAVIKITPSIERQAWYWCRATDKEFIAAGNNKEKVLEAFLKNDIDYGLNEEGFDLEGAVADISHTGTFTNTIQSLFGSTTYHLLAVAIDTQGNPISDVTEYTFESMKTPVSLNTFTIQIPEAEISYASAKVTIQPTNQDPYTWFLATTAQGSPEVLAQNYIDEMGILLNTGYSDIYKGTQTYTFPNMLDPDTEYTVIVFGYEAGRTTSIESAFFKTKPAGDPTKATFQFEVNPEKLTARGAQIAITPSDPSVLYWSEVLPAEIYTQYGSTEAAVDAYMNEVFATYQQQGYDKETIVRSFCTRGPITLSYGPESPSGAFTPNTAYIPFAVCMNLDGTKAGDVFTGEQFTTPQATLSSAWAKTKLVTYYDCDEMATKNPDLAPYVGQNLLVLDIQSEPSSDTENWYFLCAAADYTDTEQYSYEKTLSMILANIATQATIKNELQPLLLFPANQQGTFLTVAQDAAGNFGEIERVSVGPLSKSGASPAPSLQASVHRLTSLQELLPEKVVWPDYLMQRKLEKSVEHQTTQDDIKLHYFQR